MEKCWDDISFPPANIFLGGSLSRCSFHPETTFIPKSDRFPRGRKWRRGGGYIGIYIAFTTNDSNELLKTTVNTCIYSARLKRNSISLHLRPGFSLPFNFLLRKCYDWGPFSFYRGGDECANACRFLRAVGAGMRWKRGKERENERLILTLMWG